MMDHDWRPPATRRVRVVDRLQVRPRHPRALDETEDELGVQAHAGGVFGQARGEIGGVGNPVMH